MTLGLSGNAKDCNQMVGIAERTPEILDEVIRRIVKVAQPEQVILFGSTARDETTPHSDIDLLVVKKPGSNRREYEQKNLPEPLRDHGAGRCHRGDHGGHRALRRQNRDHHSAGFQRREGSL